MIVLKMYAVKVNKLRGGWVIVVWKIREYIIDVTYICFVIPYMWWKSIHLLYSLHSKIIKCTSSGIWFLAQWAHCTDFTVLKRSGSSLWYINIAEKKHLMSNTDPGNINIFVSTSALLKTLGKKIFLDHVGIHLHVNSLHMSSVVVAVCNPQSTLFPQK